MTTRRITLERTFVAPLEDVWDLWTTKDGIESWWGPDGFEVTVHSIDLRPGGLLLYAMTATDAPQVEFMKRAGMPLTTESRVTYVEVLRHQRLAYSHPVDFVPNQKPYDVRIDVELFTSAKGVRQLLTIDAMHDDVWTNRAVMGWENELNTQGAVLAARRTRETP